jgi:hypothetical protein
VFVAVVPSFALVTTLLSIVQTVPLLVSDISPLSPSVRAGIVIPQLPSTLTQFIVLIFVPDTRVSCLPEMSEASSLSAFRVEKFEFIFDKDVGLSVSDDEIVCNVLIIL